MAKQPAAQEIVSALPHQVILEDRQRFSASGVRKMLRCDDTGITMDTCCGMLTVTGRDLSVSSLSLETGEVCFAGQVDSLIYTDRIGSGGFWQRLVR